MNSQEQKIKTPKSILVKILQWLYLVVGIVAGTFWVWEKQIHYLNQFSLPRELYLAISVVAGSYCLVLALAFFTQSTNLLIFALVLIFFTTIAALIMLVVSLPNAQTVLSGKLPACIHKLDNCGTKDGVIVASAIFLGASTPILILNTITIIGTVKGIAATD